MSGSALSFMTVIASDERRYARVETGTGSLGYDRSVIDYTLPLEELPDPLPIEPLSKPFDVTITPPGSKSITCRAYVLAALADGESKIIRPLRADDTDKLLDALCTLGAEARWDGEDVYIKGVNGRFPRGGEVNLGDGGAPTRFMIAAACLAAEPVVVDGSKRMRERPIAEGVDMLRKLGAKIEYVERDGRLPIAVVPARRLRGGELQIPNTRSSQFISALLLIGACLPKGIDLRYKGPITSETYVNMTRAMLREWDIDVRCTRRGSRRVLQHGICPTSLSAQQYAIAGDASSAVYWWSAVALTLGASVTIRGIAKRVKQADVLFLASFIWLLPQRWTEQHLTDAVQWKFDSVTVRPPWRHALYSRYDCAQMPDAAMALAAVAAMYSRPENILRPENAPELAEVFTLTGLHTLRHKETDRIAALANELRRIGCTIETTDDSITIDPSTRHNDPVVIETYNDHRMAMAFGVLGLARPGISIKNPACVSKSYPTFWRDFAKLYQ